MVRFIKRAQRLGFSLAAISQFLWLRTRDAPCREVRATAEEKIREISVKRHEPAAMQATLERWYARATRSAVDEHRSIRPAKTGSVLRARAAGALARRAMRPPRSARPPVRYTARGEAGLTDRILELPVRTTDQPADHAMPVFIIAASVCARPRT